MGVLRWSPWIHDFSDASGPLVVVAGRLQVAAAGGIAAGPGNRGGARDGCRGLQWGRGACACCGNCCWQRRRGSVDGRCQRRCGCWRGREQRRFRRHASSEWCRRARADAARRRAPRRGANADGRGARSRSRQLRQGAERSVHRCGVRCGHAHAAGHDGDLSASDGQAAHREAGDVRWHGGYDVLGQAARARHLGADEATTAISRTTFTSRTIKPPCRLPVAAASSSA